MARVYQAASPRCVHNTAKKRLKSTSLTGFHPTREHKKPNLQQSPNSAIINHVSINLWTHTRECQAPLYPPPLTRCVVKGFTLAELLIALTVLAVIATFTIPKVLYSNQQQQWNVKTKEAITSVSGAYQTCIADRGLNNCNGLGPIFDYLNVTSYTGLADAGFNGLNPACGTGAFFCYKLPSGVVFWWRNNGVDFLFADTTSTSAINLYIDPDSQNIGNSGSPRFYLYRDGFLSTPTTTRGGPSAGPSSEAPWFSWN